MTSYCINWIDPVLLTLLHLSPLVEYEKSFNSLAFHPVDLYSIYSLRYQFIHSPFSVHCVYLLLFGHCFEVPTESGCCKHFARIYVYFSNEFDFYFSLLQFNTIINSHAYSILYPPNCHTHSFSSIIQFDLCGTGRCDSSF